jgi:hypothetical protein
MMSFVRLFHVRPWGRPVGIALLRYFVVKPHDIRAVLTALDPTTEKEEGPRVKRRLKKRGSLRSGPARKGALKRVRDRLKKAGPEKLKSVSFSGRPSDIVDHFTQEKMRRPSTGAHNAGHQQGHRDIGSGEPAAISRRADIQTGTRPRHKQSLKGVRGPSKNGESWEIKVAAFTERSSDALGNDTATERGRRRAATGTESPVLSNTERTPTATAKSIATHRTEHRQPVAERLTTKLQHRPAKKSGSNNFSRPSSKNTAPQNLKVAVFAERHLHTFGSDAVTKRHTRCSAAGSKTLLPTETVEARVVHRLTKKLLGGPMRLTFLRRFLGNAHQGGGLEDKQLLKNCEAFVKLHTDVFSYDASTKRLGLRATLDFDPQAEARVVKRLMSTLQGGPVKIAVLKSFLGDPSQGGGPEDKRVVVDWGAFVARHADMFSHDTVNKKLSLCVPAEGIAFDKPLESRVVKSLTAILQRGPAKVSGLKRILRQVVFGDRVEDQRMDVECRAFLSRHTDVFRNDAATNCLSLRFPSNERSSPETEARLVEWLTEQLRDGPVNVDDLQTIWRNSVNHGGMPEVQHVMQAWKAFLRRHPNTFSYDPKTKSLSLRRSIAAHGIEPPPSSEGPKAVVHQHCIQAPAEDLGPMAAVHNQCIEKLAELDTKVDGIRISS